MNNADILVIGAGAAGMMVAHTLSKAGKKVIVLEARSRAGGRIHTLNDGRFSKYVELGAEFIHGNLPVTSQLLKEAGISHHSTAGEFWNYRDGKFNKDHEFIEGWDKLMHELNKLKEDITIGDFLLEHFDGDKHQRLRSSVTRFVSGYDTADPFKASAFALREEWSGEDEESQARTNDGYGKMISYLVQDAEKNGMRLYLNTIVKEIHYGDDKVKVISDKGIVFSAEKAVIALPLGVLHGANNTESAITFRPDIPAYNKAFEQIGFGAIIKILLEFKEPFWKREEVTELAGESLSKLGFILSDEEIPTWWTQYPDKSSILTGWLGGPPAEKRKHLSNSQLLERGLQSLAGIFKIGEKELKDNLVASEVVNWTTDPFTLGSYVYDTIDSHTAREVLTKPIENILYFAGEFTYEGQAMGTVEAALTSGLEVAKKLL